MNAFDDMTFGNGVGQAMEEYLLACGTAREKYHREAGKVDAEIDTVVRSIRNLLMKLGDPNTAVSLANSLGRVFQSLTSARRDALKNELIQQRDAQIGQAQRELDAVVLADPFAKYIHEEIGEEYGQDYANTFLRALPLTFQGMKDLADSEGWCTDFERAMREAVRQGALPNYTVEATYDIEVSAVPRRFGAKQDEQWIVKVMLPAYLRTEDSYGKPRSLHTLRHYIFGEPRYMKKTDAA